MRQPSNRIFSWVATWIYSAIVYPLGITIAFVLSIFSRKLRATLSLRSVRKQIKGPVDYWIHVASYGEMEYALPILKELSDRGLKVLLTYYSVSAESLVDRLAAQISGLTTVAPIPHDAYWKIHPYVRSFREQGGHTLLLVKYELWPGLLAACRQEGVKVVLVDALKPSRAQRWLLSSFFSGLFAALGGYRSELDFIPLYRKELVGDTRVERVLERMDPSSVAASEVDAVFSKSWSSEFAIVCGSMWPVDTNLILGALEERKKMGGVLPDVIWVPHELEGAERHRVRDAFVHLGYSVSEFGDQIGTEKPRAVIVFKKGVLVELYRKGRLAFVGGAFGRGVHSVWEPAIAGCQVACGPKVLRAPEVGELRDAGLLTVCSSQTEVVKWMNRWIPIDASLAFRNPEREERIGGILARHQGASRRIVDYCENHKREL